MAEKNIDEAQTIRELTRVIDRKEIEIQDVKTSLAGVLQEIRNLNESNLDREVIKKRISEMATNTIYELLIDEKNESYNCGKTLEETYKYCPHCGKEQI